ncbi:hypothetical protein CEP54_003683 [Fusarium duplospermum]|uniref:Uncharacterized protein n=1 Tax=Fusarium duplospermum TaxID=1325734 RepID=A0A428QMK5_9HYPO|nr:hypothetical protein CEP54_003683 [Fusarium duplospermum]
MSYRAPLSYGPNEKAKEAPTGGYNFGEAKPSYGSGYDYEEADPGTKKCDRCPKRVPLDVEMCDCCREGRNGKSKERYKKKKKQGICVDCPNRAAPGSTRCLPCKLKHLESEVNRLMSLCGSCRKVPPQYRKIDKCPDCKDRLKEYEDSAS